MNGRSGPKFSRTVFDGTHYAQQITVIDILDVRCAVALPKQSSRESRNLP